ncbi:MAG: hypothetical protein WA639_19970 [Candidatus Acidiferrum sp.]
MPNFFSSLWLGLTIWSLLYVSDYAFTIVCARLYRSGVNEKIVFEGSFELNPVFQRDIDSLRLISPRFLLMLLITGLLLTLMWLLDQQSAPQFYEFVLGCMILLELAIHVRHMRNLFMFRMFVKSDCVRGRIEYSRPLILKMSSYELFIFSGLFLMLFVFTPSWFLLGGVSSCCLTAIKHRALARRASSKPITAGQPQTAL